MLIALAWHFKGFQSPDCWILLALKAVKTVYERNGTIGLHEEFRRIESCLSKRLLGLIKKLVVQRSLVFNFWQGKSTEFFVRGELFPLF